MVLVLYNIELLVLIGYCMYASYFNLLYVMCMAVCMVPDGLVRPSCFSSLCEGFLDP